MRTKRNVQPMFVSALAGLLLIVSVSLIACGGNASSWSVLVADGTNNRVLIYQFPFITGQSATTVLGQADFTTNTAAASPTAASTTNAYSMTLDSSGNLYLATGCRVLQFPRPFTTGMNATLALGQPAGATNLTSNSCTTSTTGLYSPRGLAFDSSGALWVSDALNDRVVRYVPPFAAGQAATVALGQTSTSIGSTCNITTPVGTSATSLCLPEGVAFDSSGNLWVADVFHHRVVMFPPASLVTGGAATVELGQPAATAFTSATANNGGLSETSLNAPRGLTFDSSGNLWVADGKNNRVLMYPKANLVTGGAATIVLGQTSMTTSSGSATSSNLFAPNGVAFDKNGNLWVADLANNRTVAFAPPFTTGMAATVILGQSTPTGNAANAGGVSAATQNLPAGVLATN